MKALVALAPLLLVVPLPQPHDLTPREELFEGIRDERSELDRQHRQILVLGAAFRRLGKYNRDLRKWAKEIDALTVTAEGVDKLLTEFEGKLQDSSPLEKRALTESEVERFTKRFSQHAEMRKELGDAIETYEDFLIRN